MEKHQVRLVPGARRPGRKINRQPIGFVAILSGIGTLAIIVLLAAGILDALRRRHFA